MLMNEKRAKNMAYMMAGSFLAIHLLMINVFQQCHVTPMVIFNIGSIIFYVCSFIMVKLGWLQIYAVTVYLEVVLHMTLSILLTGWDSGFQFTLIGMNVLAFYAEYVGRTLKIRYIPMLPCCLFGMFMYLLTCVYVHYYEPPYMLTEQTSFRLSLLWGVVVFSITIYVLQVFVLLVHGSEEKLERQMSHDKLTDLPNRYYMSQYLKKISEEKLFTEFWLAIADIDDFKKVNDTYGHDCGDYVLKTVASLVNTIPDVLCCRWGGEEFIFISELEDTPQSAFEKLDEVRRRVEAFPFSYEGQDLRVTMTFGMSTFTAGESEDMALTEADGRLYEGKKSGKNRVVW